MRTKDAMISGLKLYCQWFVSQATGRVRTKDAMISGLKRGRCGIEQELFHVRTKDAMISGLKLEAEYRSPSLPFSCENQRRDGGLSDK